ncbi:MAG: hypothetical protein JWN80_3001 [Microbacteriaceae bacterium]|jgi:hypothetical protein|nr:hypothetical protein [Microbacteriaceae bacterium]
MFPLTIAAVVVLAGCTAAVPSAGSSLSTSSTVTIAGGFATKAVDRGRPVVLVAAALGVPEDVFRAAFSGVTPAAAGTEPVVAQVTLNKAALLKVLSPYGITNDQLDAASNYYRYDESAGQTWPRVAATATVSGSTVTITNPGRGYTSAPTITLPDGRTATATISYGKNLSTNGSITSITINS